MRDAADNTPRSHFSNGDDGRRAVPGAMPVNERAYRRVTDQPDELRSLSRPTRATRDDEGAGYVIHLPVRVDDLAAATGLACTVAVSLGYMSELDPGETTVSTVDDQNNRHRVFCDLLLPDRSRCPQRYNHRGPCGEPPAGSERRPAPRRPVSP
ncbi:hypothetical protein [Micromonospora echinofusca]|uniref:Uncharacterized protein n=1 Tax=Micromonospora echinofusca TaxID=47858 RepID=A0ABS3VSD6_MICEH|nr:hypothetical protein [Micromonospora echinofusca]MBO4207447.1 hypothetical protein [Micromonospora echinofusca]